MRLLRLKCQLRRRRILRLSIGRAARVMGLMGLLGWIGLLGMMRLSELLGVLVLIVLRWWARALGFGVIVKW
jgi:hypothetical protein